mmetsp:Transcript_75988/g.211063  ORF Transcript_75988/g.211063 Transcript_75988/m.211063 type:complete len:292 (+) Transcript_75988:787-1662(+)
MAHESEDAFPKLARQKGRHGVHRTFFDQHFEEEIRVILRVIFENVRPRGQEYEVARRHVFVAPAVQDPEQAQTAWVHDALWEAGVDTSREMSAAGRKRVIDVAQDLDSDSPLVFEAHGLCLAGEVVEHSLPQPSVSDVRVHQLVEIMVISSRIDAVLQSCELHAVRTEEDLREHMLDLVLHRSLFLQRLDEPVFCLGAEQVFVHGFLREELYRLPIRHLHELVEAHGLAYIIDHGFITRPDEPLNHVVQRFGPVAEQIGPRHAHRRGNHHLDYDVRPHGEHIVAFVQFGDA